MQNFRFILFLLAFTPCTGLVGQNNPDVHLGLNNVQTISVKNDTVVNVILDQDFQLLNPEVSKEYSISRYKNIDFMKVNPLQLDAMGLHSEVYISNTHQGVIIISSAEPNNALTNYNNCLLVNPGCYSTYSRRDTLIHLKGVYSNQVFDFTRASSLRQDYKNAYNYSVDPRTGISWSKTSNDIFKQDWGLGQGLYDLIIVLPKILAK